VIMVNKKNELKIVKLADLLPLPFGDDKLK